MLAFGICGQRLAEHAANESYSATRRSAIDSEAQALSAEYQRVIATIKFNGVSLFQTDGSQITTQVGLISSADDRITFNLGSILIASQAVSDGTFSTSYTAGVSPFAASAGDLDDDSDNDLVVSNTGSGGFSALLNYGNGSFKASSGYVVGTTPSSNSTADFNGDGRSDLLPQTTQYALV